MHDCTFSVQIILFTYEKKDLNSRCDENSFIKIYDIYFCPKQRPINFSRIWTERMITNWNVSYRYHIFLRICNIFIQTVVFCAMRKNLSLKKYKGGSYEEIAILVKLFDIVFYIDPYHYRIRLIKISWIN